MKVITSGRRYLDIDAYGACIAFAELLRAQNQDAKAYSSAPLNESISPKVRHWHADLSREYTPQAQDTFTIIDLSDPAAFDNSVILTQVEEVIDHHLGFEDYWRAQPTVKAQIEFVGAACTQVYERWEAAGLLRQMSQTSARLLICGILDNTLNFGANITTDRDRGAYSSLLAKADLPGDWTAQYFADCESAILQNISEAVRNDSKVLKFRTIDELLGVGQLTVWDAQTILEDHMETIRTELVSIKPNWFMNLISLKDRCSYLITDDTRVRNWLSELLKIQFNGSVASTTEHAWLRKEIVKQDILAAKNET